MSDFVLYNYFRSSASYRVRIAMNLKELDFDYRPVHLLNNGGEQHNEHYRTLNPSEQVPTLVHNGNVIGQSLAILQYLDDVSPKFKLFPNDPAQKAKCWQICEVVNSGIQPLQNLGVAQYLEKNLKLEPTLRQAWMDHWIGDGMAALEQLLEKTAGTYAMGGTVTAADVVIVPQIYAARRFKAPIEKYPNLSRIEKNCLEIEAFKKAHPYRQVDTPADLKI